jgi:hypothetical protein
MTRDIAHLISLMAKGKWVKIKRYRGVGYGRRTGKDCTRYHLQTENRTRWGSGPDESSTNARRFAELETVIFTTGVSQTP